MGYYDVYLKRQTEIMDESMEAARRDLLQAASDERAYREALQKRITGLDKTIALYQKAAKSGGITQSDRLAIERHKLSIDKEERMQAQAILGVDEAITKRANFNLDSLQRRQSEFAKAAANENPHVAITAVLDQARADKGVAGEESMYVLADRARRQGELAQLSYAAGLEGFLKDRLVGHDISGEAAVEIKKTVAAIVWGSEKAEEEWGRVGNASVRKKENDLREEAKKRLPQTAWARRAGVSEIEAGLEGVDEAGKIAIEAQTFASARDEERTEIKSQLEALGAPMELTEEAVRARAGEIAKPQLYEPTPFGAPQERAREAISAGRERRLADLVEGREGPGRERMRVTSEGEPIYARPFAEDARIRRLERLTGANDPGVQFDKLSPDDQIIYMQVSKAQKTYQGGGSVLPEDRSSSEWRRAQEMFDQLEGGSLRWGSGLITAATQLAKSDLGSGAPPSDIRRQRDEILERLFTLTINEQNASAASTPAQEAKERPPEDPGVSARREQMLAELAEDEAVRARREQMLEELAQDEARRQTESGNGLEPSPEVEAEQVIQERVQGPVRMEEGPEGTFSASEIKTDSLGFTPIDVPGEPLGTSEVSIPLPPAPGQSDIAVPTIAAPTLMQTFFPRAENPEDMAYRRWIAAGADAVKAGAKAAARPVGQEIAKQVPELLEEFSGSMYKGSMAERATVEFSESTSKIPGTPRYHDLLARAAQAMGLPLPTWYAEATPGAQVSIRKTGASI